MKQVRRVKGSKGRQEGGKEGNQDDDDVDDGNVRTEPK